MILLRSDKARVSFTDDNLIEIFYLNKKEPVLTRSCKYVDVDNDAVFMLEAGYREVYPSFRTLEKFSRERIVEILRNHLDVDTIQLRFDLTRAKFVDPSPWENSCNAQSC